MPTPRFTTKHLSAFIAVADARSFARAGQRLHLSSSAVSQLVSDLESSLGFRLFDRTTRSVSMTPAGQEFYVSGKSVLTHMELAQAVAENIRDCTAGIVRCAAPLVLASTVLPNAVKDYILRKPDVLVRIRDSSVADLVDRVADDSVDLAIGPDWPVTDEVARLDLFESRWVLWFRFDHPLIERNEISWSELRHHPLVVAGRDYERSISLTYGGYDENKQITPVHSVENISTAFGMAEAGLGVLIAPAYVGLLGHRFNLVMRPLIDPVVTRKVCLYHSSARALSPAAEDFRKHLTAWLHGRDDPGLSVRT